MKVVVQSFKPSGKYYTTGEYETKCQLMFQIFDEVRTRALDGNIPGLAQAAAWTEARNQMDWILHVDVPDHTLNFPGFIVLFRDADGKRTDKKPQSVTFAEEVPA